MIHLYLHEVGFGSITRRLHLVAQYGNLRTGLFAIWWISSGAGCDRMTVGQSRIWPTGRERWALYRTARQDVVVQGIAEEAGENSSVEFILPTSGT